MQKIFNGLLLIAFLGLVVLFGYKTLKTPEVSKVPVASASVDSNKENTTLSCADSKFSEEDLNTKIHDYIVAHPEILVESIETMQRKKIEESNKKAANYLLQNKSGIEDEGTPPMFGNKNADITIVVFYDYNCSFCKQANLITNEILATDPGVKIILRPLPILGGTSMYATKVALAVHKISEEAFPIIHNEMIKMKPITEEGVKALLAAHNIDYKIVDNELNSFSIKELIAKNFNLAQSLGIKGAPSYVVNGVFIPGLIDKERFAAIIGELRQIASQTQNSESTEPNDNTNNSEITEIKDDNTNSKEEPTKQGTSK